MNKNKLIKLVALGTAAVLLTFSGVLVSCLMNNKAKEEPVQNLAYTLSADKTYYIVSGIGESKDPTLVIPAEYKELPVKEVKERAFEDCDLLTSVKVGKNITKIGKEAFKDCDNLAKVSFEKRIENIDDYAFQATALTDVVIPSGVNNMGVGVFYECAGLKSIVVEEDNTTYKSIDGNLYTKDGKEILQYAVAKTETSFTIPTTVTKIGVYAFSYCNLAEISLAENVQSISFYAFSNSEKLTSVTFGKSVKTINKGAFQHCKALVKISYQGTAEEWEQVKKGEGWSEGVAAPSVDFNN